MQKISNQILTVAVSENDAQMVHLQKKGQDYFRLANGEAGKIMLRSGKKSILEGLNWTVVDKGDDRVSLMAIDSPKSRQIFPYHFELMVTYVLVGSSVKVQFLLTNNSQKDFSAVIAADLNLNLDFQDKLQVASSDFSRKSLKDGKAQYATDPLDAAAGDQRKAALTLTVN